MSILPDGPHVKTIGHLLELEKQGEILLPNYQRPFVWEAKEQKRLLTSLIMGLPIGSLLMSVGKGSDYSSRALCYGLDTKSKDTSDVNFLLDGQQRLSVIKSIFSDLFDKATYEVHLKNQPNININDYPTKLIKGKDRLLPKELCYQWYLDLTQGNEDASAEDIEESIDLLDIETAKTNAKFLSEEDYDSLIQYERVTVTSKPSSKLENISITRDNLFTECTKNKIIPLWRASMDMESRNQGGDAYNFKPLEDGTQPLLERIVESIIDTIINGSGESDEAKRKGKKRKLTDIIQRFFDRILRQTGVPLQVIRQEDEYKMIAIFNQINTGGVKLTTYDLIVARYGGGKNDNLSAKIKGYFVKGYFERYSKKLENSNAYDFFLPNTGLKEIEFDFLKYFWDENNKVPVANFCHLFIQVLCLENVLTKAEEKSKNGAMDEAINNLNTDTIKQTFILRTIQKSDNIDHYLKATLTNFIETFKFLHLVCGVPTLSALPYRLIFLPLYCSLRSEKHQQESILARCAYWYWTALFSGRYFNNQNANCIEDIKRLYKFCHHPEGDSADFKQEEGEVFNKQRYSDKKTLALTDMSINDHRDINSNLTSGLLQFLLSQKQPSLKDWQNKNENEDQKVIDVTAINSYEIHHLISLPYADEKGKIRSNSQHYLNSPMNKTYISRKRNRKVSSFIVDRYQALEFHEKPHCLPDEFSKVCDKIMAYHKDSKSQETKFKAIVEHLYQPRFKKFKEMYESRMVSLRSKF